MGTEIMPRPDLRTDWHGPPRHRRPRRLAWVRAEITGRPRLLAAILALGVFAFVGGGLFHPPAPLAGPSTIHTPSAHPTRNGPVPPTSGPVRTATPSTGATTSPSRIARTPKPPRPRETPTASKRPTASPSRTRVTSPRPRPSHTAVHTPPVHTEKPKPPPTGGPGLLP